MTIPPYLKSLSSAVVAILLFTNCTNDQDDGSDGQLRLSARATFEGGTPAKGTTAKTINADLEVSEFLVNVREFELEVDDDEFESANEDSLEDDDLWDDDGFLDSDDEIELQGPFELNLLDGQITFLNIPVPDGRFEELEFEFDASTDAQSDLFGKSILIRGTYQGMPFEFWHDFEEELELDFDDPTLDIVISGSAESLVIDFDLSLLFNGSLGIDLSQAQDGNGDGLIEISPMDADGNNGLAEQIKEKVKEVIDLLDD
ncbi:MAG: hypothetical protein P8Z38_00980 [Robiginitalea sp.]